MMRVVETAVLMMYFHSAIRVSAWGPQGRHLPAALRPVRRLSSIEPQRDISDVGEAKSELEYTVVARCPQTRRAIECVIDTTVTVGDTDYYLLHPVDDVVAICGFDANNQPRLIDAESAEMDEIFPFAQFILQDEDIDLFRSACVLTLLSANEDDDEDDGDASTLFLFV